MKPSLKSRAGKLGAKARLTQRRRSGSYTGTAIGSLSDLGRKSGGMKQPKPRSR